MAIQKFFTSRSNAQGNIFVGDEGRLWFDEATATIYYSDGVTPGGIPVNSGGGGGGSANIVVKDEGVTLTTSVTTLNFVGAGVTATNSGSIVTVNIPSNSGPTGATGPQGIQGDAGATGVTGLTGATGVQGASGSTGPQGIQGASGSTGLTGATGSTGLQGIQGASGSTGPIGLTGATGIAGASGYIGADGATGAAGLDGATGPAGIDGATGPQGIQGASGALSNVSVIADSGSYLVTSNVKIYGGTNATTRVANGIVYIDTVSAEDSKTFEKISKNLKSYNYVINKVNGQITSLEYTVPSLGIITKTINYANGAISSISLSGATLGAETYTKTFVYANNAIAGATYSVI